MPEDDEFATSEKAARALLAPNESILEKLRGTVEDTNVTIVLTNKRILALGMVFGFWKIRPHTWKFDIEKVARMLSYKDDDMFGSSLILKIETIEGNWSMFTILWGDIQKFLSTWESLKQTPISTEGIAIEGTNTFSHQAGEYRPKSEPGPGLGWLIIFAGLLLLFVLFILICGTTGSTMP
jgi:hypothetical protein